MTVNQVFSRRASGWTHKRRFVRGFLGDDPMLWSLLDPYRNVPISVLDVGAGGGNSTSEILKVLPHARVTAVESSQGMLRVVRDRFSADDRVRVVDWNFEGEAPSDLSERFEVICLIQVLQHSGIKILRRLAEHCKSDGRVVLLVPGHRHFADLIPFELRDPFGRFRKAQLIRIMRQAGFVAELAIDLNFSMRFWRNEDVGRFLLSVGALEKANKYRPLVGHHLASKLLEIERKVAERGKGTTFGCHHIVAVGKPIKDR